MDVIPYWIDLSKQPADDGKEGLKFFALGSGAATLIFPRGKNPDGLMPQIIETGDSFGKAVRLAVKADAYRQPLDEPGDGVNERCELREDPKGQIGQDAWYGFSIRIPDDFPRKPLRCVVAQVKMAFDDQGNGSPAFSLRIDDGQWVATVEHLYEKADEDDHRFLSDMVDGVCGLPGAAAYDHHDFCQDANRLDQQVRALLAVDSAGLPPHLRRFEFTRCTTGVKLATFGRLPEADGRWSDFIVRVKSSGKKDEDGTIELFSEGKRIARASGEFGFCGPKSPRSQYFKIGPYRNKDAAWGTEPAGIEVRDIRRGPTYASVDLTARPAAQA